MKIKNLLNIAIILAFFVMALGAYTRLTHAGLGCPDWPGCYGHLIVNKADTTKAWTEMLHRYAAGSLVLLILIIFSYINYYKLPLKALSLTLISLIVFQALLGMWTVTLKLLPIVVTGHLLGGLLTFITLSVMRIKLSFSQKEKPIILSYWILLGIILTFIQIILGGWVSSNYAGISCIGFPQCNGSWLPSKDLNEAFSIFTNTAINYQGGILSVGARMAIQMTHRLMAFIVFIYWISFGSYIIVFYKNLRLRAGLIIGLLIIQCSLGIINALWFLPLWAAVMHNSFAALLFLSTLYLYLTVTYARNN